MSRTTLRLGLVFILCAAVGQAPTAQQRPVFRTGVNFVTVDAYPLVAGRVVEGLTREDFEVREDGRVQVVESFDFVPADARLTESDRRDPNNQQDMLDQLADPRSRVFVAFLDVHHVDVSGAFYSRLPLIELFDRLLAPSDLIALMTSRNNPRNLTFGRRSTVVRQQLGDFWTWREPDVLPNDAEEAALRTCFPEPEGLAGTLIARRRQDQLLSTLEGLVEFLGEVREGRKTIFLFSQGWTWAEPTPDLLKHLDPTWASKGPAITNEPWRNLRVVTSLAEGGRAACETELQRLAALNSPPRVRQLLRDATMANVVMYPVDPSGVGGGPGTERLMEFASNTGGTAVSNRNDLVQGIIDVSREFAGYYLLGYASDNRKTDGALRRIDVKVKRPGVEVKARRGYRALTVEEAAARAPKPESPVVTTVGPSAVDLALSALSRIRRADDGTFSVSPYLKADAAPLLGVAEVFRATPSPRSPLVPATAPVFRRSERVHIEWPVAQVLTESSARILGRTGEPLALSVALSEREGSPRPMLMADTVLGALAAGDYLIELRVTSAEGSRTSLIAFRVVP
ncbi:MAG TPA: VWA domain-containing protein [Vicinamibacterales bacterium]|nr:VWA domain-containing protein [Vicinamibacterales bacterium]